MPKKNDVVGARLLSYVERIERLEAEKKALSEDISAVKSEAKGSGFDVPTINRIIKIRKLTTAERQEQDALLDIYMAALGMLGDTPLGEAAIRRLSGKSPPAPDDQPEPTPPPAALQEPFLSATVEDARKFGANAAADGNPVTDNPFPARDPRRAAWDEAWCAATGSDGMEIPEAWRRKKPKKGPDDDQPDDNGGEQ